MNYVIDANVLISMLITSKASYYTLTKAFRFYAPTYALQEIDEYQSVIFEKSRLQATEVRDFARRLFPSLRIVPSFAIDPDNQRRAEQLIQDIDPKDQAYVALALQTEAVLLSRDKPLVDGIRKQGFRQAIMFDQFLREL
ncbi:MAG: PIN domain-containing protein [Tunicatimonas sp.]